MNVTFQITDTKILSRDPRVCGIDNLVDALSDFVGAKTPGELLTGAKWERDIYHAIVDLAEAARTESWGAMSNSAGYLGVQVLVVVEFDSEED